MKRPILAAILAIALAGGSAAKAQSLADTFNDSLLTSHSLVHVDGRPADSELKEYVDSVRRVISKFYYDQFRHFQDPVAPYFMFLSKDAQLAMGIGGSVRMRTYYDMGEAMPSSAFAPYLIPMQSNPASRRALGVTPSGTELFFRVIGRNKTLGEYQLYIEADFTGYQGRDFKLKKSYAMINDFTVGYAPSTFSDPAAQPAMVDGAGPNSKMSPTRCLVRWMPTVKDRYIFAISAEAPSAQADYTTAATEKVRDWMPDFGAFAQYQWERGQHVRLAGILRTLPYRDISAARNHNVAGWGVQLSGVAHPSTALTTYLTLNYGHGYGSLGGDLGMGNYDLTATPGTPGRMYAPRGWGGCAAVQYNLSPSLFFTLLYSTTHYCPRRPVDGDEYKTGSVAALNMFWMMTKRMTVAAEIDYGHRANFSGDKNDAYRANLMCQFSF